MFEQDVVSVVAPGVEGYFGILRGRAPLLAELGLGIMKVTPPDGVVRPVAMTGGVLECSESGVLVLADSAERSDDIDIQRAEVAADRARQRLAQAHDPDGLDSDRARAALIRALNRLKAAERG